MFSPYNKFDEQKLQNQQYGTSRMNNSSLNGQDSGLDIGGIVSNLGGMFGKNSGGGFEFGGGTGSSGGIASQLGGLFGGGSGDGLSSMSGKMGGGKMGYADAVTPWFDKNKSTGQKIGSSVGAGAGFYFGGPIGSAVGGWLGDKVGGLFS